MNEIVTNQDPTLFDDDMLPEYDFTDGVRGKHAAAYQKGYRVIIHKKDGSTEIQEFILPPEAILLDPDVRLYFKDSATVNQTLRGLIALLPTTQDVDRAFA